MKPFAFLRTPLNNALTRQRLAASLLLSSLALLAAPQAGAVMMDIGSLPGDWRNVAVNGISGNSEVVMGHFQNGANYQLFTWTPAQTFTSLGAFSGLDPRLRGISQNGSVIAASLFDDGVLQYRAYRWTAATGFVALGPLGGAASLANGISNDGNVVVGTASTSAGSVHAFRWTAGTMQDLGVLAQDPYSEAFAVSGDGKVAVGMSGAALDTRAVLWDATGVIKDLGGSDSSQANAANVDGTVVVGDDGDYAFRWTDAGGLQHLSSANSTANDVNADGSVVVGRSNQADGTFTAYRWTQPTGMLSLGVLSGESSSNATGVSDDGNTVVGTSGARAFIWTAPSPTTPTIPTTPTTPTTPTIPTSPIMQDLANLQLSQLTSANTLGHLAASQNRRMRDLNQQQCLPGGAQVYCLSAGLSAYSGEGEGSGKQQIGQVTGGLRINEQFTVGASANLGQADLRTDAAKQDNAYGLALWGSYQQQPDELGFIASASLAMGQSHNSFERGVDLADVQRARAHTTLSSTGVRLAAGYGLKVRDSLVTPEVALSHRRTDSDGFTERNVALPLTLESTGSQETYATFGVRSATPLSPKATLQLGVAVDALLNDSTDPLKGHSNVPGLSQFELRSDLDKRSLVPMAMVGVSYALSPNATLAGQVQAGASSYQQQDAVYGVGVQYRYSF